MTGAGGNGSLGTANLMRMANRMPGCVTVARSSSNVCVPFVTGATSSSNVCVFSGICSVVFWSGRPSQQIVGEAASIMSRPSALRVTWLAEEPWRAQRPSVVAPHCIGAGGGLRLPDVMVSRWRIFD